MVSLGRLRQMAAGKVNERSVDWGMVELAISESPTSNVTRKLYASRHHANENGELGKK
jgi:hypothetical protein